MAKRDEYPVTVLKLGNGCRVVAAELRRLLDIATEQTAAITELCA
ncbi:hypothetical protein OHU45_26745 [Streptomyces tubercidicus]